jgi:hypothetical protein
MTTTQHRRCQTHRVRVAFLARYIREYFHRLPLSGVYYQRSFRLTSSYLGFRLLDYAAGGRPKLAVQNTARSFMSLVLTQGASTLISHAELAPACPGVLWFQRQVDRSAFKRSRCSP